MRKHRARVSLAVLFSLISGTDTDVSDENGTSDLIIEGTCGRNG